MNKFLGENSWNGLPFAVYCLPHFHVREFKCAQQIKYKLKFPYLSMVLVTMIVLSLLLSIARFTMLLFVFQLQDWHGIISSSLGGILLLGSSTLIAITVVIDSELGSRKSPTSHLSGGMRGAIGLSWFMPILYAVTTLLIYTVMGGWPSNWWITVNTFGFALFVIIETLFVILFSLLFYTLVHKLSYLAKKHDKHGILITKRYEI